MTRPIEELNVVWITGASCDGCTIAVLGDDSTARFEDLVTGRVEGLPRLSLIHPVLSIEEGSAFVDLLRRAAARKLQPYLLVVESSLPATLPEGSWGWLGEEDARPVDLRDWVARLAGGAEAVIAVGDCGVFGGPHTGDDESNPSGATGVESVVGCDFRSAAGIPVIHLPGCSVPPVVIATFVSVIRYLQGEAPRPQLDTLGRPSFAYEVPA